MPRGMDGGELRRVLPRRRAAGDARAAEIRPRENLRRSRDVPLGRDVRVRSGVRAHGTERNMRRHDVRVGNVSAHEGRVRVRRRLGRHEVRVQGKIPGTGVQRLRMRQQRHVQRHHRRVRVHARIQRRALRDARTDRSSDALRVERRVERRARSMRLRRGYVGETCASTCDATTDCAGNGACASDGTCACVEGFSGAGCASCADGYAGYPLCAPLPEAGSDQCHDPAALDAYRGDVSATIDGRPCQRWDEQTPVEHDFDPSDASNAALGIGAHNHCRNPSGDFLQWCYVDGETRAEDEAAWGYCAAPACFDPPAATDPPKQCALFGELTISQFDGTVIREFPRAEATDAACTSAADDDVKAGEDLALHSDVYVRAAISSSTARVYLSAVGVDEITGSVDSNDDRPSVVIRADRAFEVGRSDGSSVRGHTDATPRVSDWTLAAFSVTGLASYSTTLTWTNGMVLDVVSIECYECDDGNGYSWR